jgi:sugar phosphate isomerase/epimerase
MTFLSRDTIDFLGRLRVNNDRQWFEAHRTDYDAHVKRPGEAFASALAGQLEAATGEPHDCRIFRIHRDVRFSKDKTPYNAHLHISFSPDGGCKEGGPAWMFGLDPDGLTLAAVCTGHIYGEDGLGLVGPDESLCRQAMARMQAIVDFVATHFEPGTMVTIGRSRGPGYPGDVARSLEQMAVAFRAVAAYALPRGVRVVLEPINIHQANYIHTTQEGIAMVRRVDRPNFGLMVDVYHMNIEDVDIYASLREADGMIWFVHFADNNRHWPGSAHLDFEKIVATLNEIGYEGYVSMEIFPWPDPDTAAMGRRRIMIPAAEAATRGPGYTEVIGGVLKEECDRLYR